MPSLVVNLSWLPSYNKVSGFLGSIALTVALQSGLLQISLLVDLQENLDPPSLYPHLQQTPACCYVLPLGLNLPQLAGWVAGRVL